MVPEILALVHTLHGPAGVGATLALVRGHETRYSTSRPVGAIDENDPAARKSLRCQDVAVEPCETLEVDIMSIGTTSRGGNMYFW